MLITFIKEKKRVTNYLCNMFIAKVEQLLKAGGGGGGYNSQLELMKQVNDKPFLSDIKTIEKLF